MQRFVGLLWQQGIVADLHYLLEQQIRTRGGWMKYEGIKTMQHLYETRIQPMSVLFQRYLSSVFEAFMHSLSNERHMLVMQKPTPTQVII
jgi:hypothetical protein